jgi:hypothetical protein
VLFHQPVVAVIQKALFKWIQLPLYGTISTKVFICSLLYCEVATTAYEAFELCYFQKHLFLSGRFLYFSYFYVSYLFIMLLPRNSFFSKIFPVRVITLIRLFILYCLCCYSSCSTVPISFVYLYLIWTMSFDVPEKRNNISFCCLLGEVPVQWARWFQFLWTVTTDTAIMIHSKELRYIFIPSFKLTQLTRLVFLITCCDCAFQNLATISLKYDLKVAVETWIKNNCRLIRLCPQRSTK